MAEQSLNPETLEPKVRAVGGTEYSWCRAVPGGTGITVLALLLSKPPDLSTLQNALHKLQNSHPILRSKLTSSSTATNTFSFIIPPISSLQIKSFDLSSTSNLLQTLSNSDTRSPVSPFHHILEHELNQNPWSDPDDSGTDMFFASVYDLSDTKWVVALRIHTAVCDLTAAVSLLRELLGTRLIGEKEVDEELGNDGEVSLGIEDLIPRGKDQKPFWARGIDMLGYSLNSFRLSNLDFKDADSPRVSEMVRLQMDPDECGRLLAACKARGIKLCGALAAAGLMAAHSSKHLPDYQWEKYSVVTLIDCRKILDPPLDSQHPGFYHSAIVNTHDVNGGEKLWELARRCYMSFANAVDSNKHFSDMNDLNFLMCKAIDNPGLTPSSSLRSSFISVFADGVIDDSSEIHQDVGLEDCVGCASVHGIGPSIAIFETIRDGKLDCACVYPSPLHSREQMLELIDNMKKILLEGTD
ncbi:hypothetical protein HHK36_011417 [Tetracentron sinense]|uniref:Phthiocerol/phthiodiolone dimycocerosyl transferase C-terminal domain-containing protein n=1 Tax=Tetracentron sinense TaxID=13715 RepID=A0A834ZCN9_TETSI|nr:hypothetical protein HHK36_011417 [Tetracentron sinense]